MKNKIVVFIVLLLVFKGFSQDTKKSFLTPYKIGFLYNNGSNENFIFDDPDYTYSTQTYKGQLFYQLGSWKRIDFELIVQPQIQFLRHQLLNEWYVTPDQENYQDKIVEFTKPKSMHLYGIEFGFSGITKIIQNLYFQGSLSLGFSVIDTRTERLAQGFTFIENLSFGFLYKTTPKHHFYIGTNFGHVSNLDFQKPNDGYNILGFDVGYAFVLK
ncbi:acyloxyacyl hydrolase [Polaribacter gangjinensis]|nr:acyloxyacyl hydrolase [Polaribacter gangjinensis]